jgi:hypothetical protein
MASSAPRGSTRSFVFPSPSITAMDDSFTNMEFKTHPDTLVHDSFELLVETPALSRH